MELHSALDSLLRWYSVPLIYLEKDIAGKKVTAECDECNFEEAIKKVIEHQSLVARVVGSQVVLQAQPVERKIPPATISGTITDSLTGEWLVDATVLLRHESPEGEQIHRICSTNQFGFYSLQNVRPGTYLLTIRSIGYQTLNLSLTVEAGVSTTINHTLYPRDVVMQEITVEGQRSAFTASEGISRGVYIRATPSDQNQYLLEGARIYNPSHFGGVLSTFNGDALRDVQTLAGGVPPYYGGRIGGILDVTLRNGREDVSGVAGVGTLGSSLMLEGPVAEQTTFLLSGRRGYPNVLMERNPAQGTRSNIGTTEVMAKVSHTLAGNSRIFFSGYFGRDSYDNSTRDAFGRELFNSLGWGNAAANLRWMSIMSPSLFVHASAVYSRYGFDIEHRLPAAGITATPAVFPSNYFIEDFALRANAEHFYDEYHTMRGGVELIRHRFGGMINEFSMLGASASLNGVAAWELAVYFQDQWRLSPAVSAELGARATAFIGKLGTFSAVDPRFSILVRLNDELRLYSSLSSVNQFVHPYRNSGVFVFYPTPFIYPSTDAVRPATSMQVSLGMEKVFRDGDYSIAVESYYRVTQKLHEFVFDSSAIEFTDAMFFGEGTVYGAEVTVNKRAGDVTGMVRYSLSNSKNRFPELNGGEPYTPRFDRRHELLVSLSYSRHENWTFGALCVLASDQSQGSGDAAKAANLEPGPIRVEEAQAPFDINGGRFPGFQRLELRATYRFLWEGFPVQATLRLLNGYGLLDPFAWTLRDVSDPRRSWSVRFDPPDLFPLYPAVSINVKF
ncbi:MAG: TonB-dependent receptor [Bacteroidetes bacterium]|nr:TonB-dependent receptor [Bacteroidota bacterium]MCW5895038.1 TonB-dependent receptor [Bacteroidota bacterium]